MISWYNLLGINLSSTGPYPCFFVHSTGTHSPTVSCFFNVLLDFFLGKIGKRFCIFIGKNYGYKLHSTMRPWLHVEDVDVIFLDIFVLSVLAFLLQFPPPRRNTFFVLVFSCQTRILVDVSNQCFSQSVYFVVTISTRF